MTRNGRANNQGIEIENPLAFTSKAEGANYASRCPVEKGSHIFVWFILSFLLAVLSVRIFYLQVVKGGYYGTVAENNRVRSIVIKAPRGLIRDKKGEVLARNVPSFDAVFIPSELSKEYEERKSLYQKLSGIIGMSESEIEGIMEPADFALRNSFLIKENIGYETALILEEKQNLVKGVYVEKTARRDYIDGPTFSPFTGYDGKITKEELTENPGYLMTDYIGKNGLEYTYEKYLHGKHGEHRMEVDSNGSIKEELGIVNPIPGDELVLHLDAGLQRKTVEVLSKILQENEDATGASAVAINPQNGGVLSLVNVPSYDNNLFAEGISASDYANLMNDPKKPLLNRAISGEYPPGSTFKPLIAAAALEEKVIGENTTVDCHGNIAVGGWNFPDWKTHGLTDVKKAIAESCDVFFYTVGGGWNNISGLSINRIEKYSRMFGLGDAVGIDLPWESKGNIPTEEWKFKKFGEKWYIGDNYHCSIGQGFITTTPLQLASYMSAIANGGTLYRPHMVDKVVSSANKQERVISPEIVRQNFISQNNIRIVREGMRQTVTDGSGVTLKELKVPTAGKTGTAQFGSEEKTHSWYISFAPYDKPEIAMIVLVEGGGEGHDWAVPATKELYKWYFEERAER